MTKLINFYWREPKSQARSNHSPSGHFRGQKYQLHRVNSIFKEKTEHKETFLTSANRGDITS